MTPPSEGCAAWLASQAAGLGRSSPKTRHPTQAFCLSTFPFPKVTLRRVKISFAILKPALAPASITLARVAMTLAPVVTPLGLRWLTSSLVNIAFELRNMTFAVVATTMRNTSIILRNALLCRQLDSIIATQPRSNERTASAEIHRLMGSRPQIRLAIADSTENLKRFTD